MGQIQAVYKHRRDANEAGTEITDPKDWFENIILYKFDDMKPRYDALPDEKKTVLKGIFDDMDVMAS